MLAFETAGSTSMDKAEGEQHPQQQPPPVGPSAAEQSGTGTVFDKLLKATKVLQQRVQQLKKDNDELRHSQAKEILQVHTSEIAKVKVAMRKQFDRELAAWAGKQNESKAADIQTPAQSATQPSSVYIEGVFPAHAEQQRLMRENAELRRRLSKAQQTAEDALRRSSTKTLADNEALQQSLLAARQAEERNAEVLRARDATIRDLRRQLAAAQTELRAKEAEIVLLQPRPSPRSQGIPAAAAGANTSKSQGGGSNIGGSSSSSSSSGGGGSNGNGNVGANAQQRRSAGLIIAPPQASPRMRRGPSSGAKTQSPQSFG